MIGQAPRQYSSRKEGPQTLPYDDISKWCHANKMLIKAQKTKEMIIDFVHKDSKIDLHVININDSEIERVDTAKLLGITISNNLSWETHVRNITNKASQS